MNNYTVWQRWWGSKEWNPIKEVSKHKEARIYVVSCERKGVEADFRIVPDPKYGEE